MSHATRSESSTVDLPDGGPVVPWPAHAGAGSRLAPGVCLQNRFRLRTIIGEGAMGVVWLADDLQLDGEVALKMVHESLARDPEHIARLKAEANKNHELTHEHIVRVRDFQHDPDRGLAFFTMNHVRGSTLKELVEQHPKGLPLDRVTPWARQLAEALDFARTKKVMHRDVKPANVMIDERDRALLMDFGVARIVLEDRTHLTSNEIAGTPAYMSPQHISGTDSYSNDVYSLAATLYEALSGRRPFEGVGLRSRIENETPAAIPGVPRHVNDAILAGLAKDPRDRPASARDLALGIAVDDPAGTLEELERKAGEALDQGRLDDAEEHVETAERLGLRSKSLSRVKKHTATKRQHTRERQQAIDELIDHGMFQAAAAELETLDRYHGTPALRRYGERTRERLRNLVAKQVAADIADRMDAGRFTDALAYVDDEERRIRLDGALSEIRSRIEGERRTVGEGIAFAVERLAADEPDEGIGRILELVRRHPRSDLLRRIRAAAEWSRERIPELRRRLHDEQFQSVLDALAEAPEETRDWPHVTALRADAKDRERTWAERSAALDAAMARGSFVAVDEAMQRLADRFPRRTTKLRPEVDRWADALSRVLADGDRAAHDGNRSLLLRMIRRLERLSPEHPKRGVWRARQAELLVARITRTFARGDVDAARRQAQRAVEEFPESPTLRAARDRIGCDTERLRRLEQSAERHRGDGHVDEAVADLRRCAAICPDAGYGHRAAILETRRRPRDGAARRAPTTLAAVTSVLLILAGGAWLLNQHRIAAASDRLAAGEWVEADRLLARTWPWLAAGRSDVAAGIIRAEHDTILKQARRLLGAGDPRAAIDWADRLRVEATASASHHASARGLIDQAVSSLEESIGSEDHRLAADPLFRRWVEERIDGLPSLARIALAAARSAAALGDAELAARWAAAAGRGRDGEALGWLAIRMLGPDPGRSKGQEVEAVRRPERLAPSEAEEPRVPAPTLELTLADGVTLSLQRIPGPAGGQGFLLGRTEVTVAQWRAVMDPDAGSSRPADDRPRRDVTFEEASEFCVALGCHPALEGRRVRLPTSIEWLAACPPVDLARLEESAWFRPNAGGRIRPVGKRRAGPNGLHDMHGGVWEWTSCGEMDGAFRTILGGSVSTPRTDWGGGDGPPRTLQPGAAADAETGFRVLVEARPDA